MTDRERLADLETRERKLAQEVLGARRALRGKYAAMVEELPVELLTEKGFRDILGHSIRIGGEQAIAALRSLHPPQSGESPQPKPTRRVVPAASTAEPRAAGQDQPG